MPDARTVRSKNAIKNAFIILLNMKHMDEIVMTEIARIANVSRSTLYTHYGNAEEIYRDLVHDFASTLTPLHSQLRCDTCQPEEQQPFCVALRDTEKYRAVVREPRFMQTLFSEIEQNGVSLNALQSYESLGLDTDQAHALVHFQMTGCYSLAMANVPIDDWSRIQNTVDTFIRGGMNALRSQPAKSPASLHEQVTTVP